MTIAAGRRHASSQMGRLTELDQAAAPGREAVRTSTWPES